MAKSGWMKPIDFYSLEMMFVILASCAGSLLVCFIVGAVLLSELVDLVSAHEAYVGFWLFVVLCRLLVVLLS